jgi:hypothetical protein
MSKFCKAKRVLVLVLARVVVVLVRVVEVAAAVVQCAATGEAVLVVACLAVVAAQTGMCLPPPGFLAITARYSHLWTC